VLQAAYRRRRDLMNAAFRQHMPEWVNWQEVHGGLYYWAELPEQADTSREGPIFRAALEAGVLYVPGDLCFAETPSRPGPRNCVRLSFGGTPSHQIEEGVQRLGGVLKNARL
jgi:2-aminoadipate transaminase